MLRIVTKEETLEAQKIIQASPELILRTPLVKLNYDRGASDPEIYLKLENLQPISSFKVRAAAVAIQSTNKSKLLKDGVFTASAGNMGQACAVVAKQFGYKCVVVVPDNAPKTKLEAIRRYDATIIAVPFNDWWSIIEHGVNSPIVHKLELNGIFIHPVTNQDVLAGNSTIGLEILQDLPDVSEIYAPFGGGGLSCGIASAIKSFGLTSCKVYGCEPTTAAPLAWSFANNKRCEAFPMWQTSFVDGCGGKSLIPDMWPIAQQVLDGGVAVEPMAAAKAIELMVERNRIVAEGAAGCAVAAALKSQQTNTNTITANTNTNTNSANTTNSPHKIVCIVSGGGLDSTKLVQILSGCPQMTGPNPHEFVCPTIKNADDKHKYEHEHEHKHTRCEGAWWERHLGRLCVAVVIVAVVMRLR